jgi:hypothetical protein
LNDVILAPPRTSGKGHPLSEVEVLSTLRAIGKHRNVTRGAVSMGGMAAHAT